MFSGYIKVCLSDGTCINYANSNMYQKSGVDSLGSTIIPGVPCMTYYWTGNPGDAYEEQTNTGEIKKDYETLLGQIGTAGNIQWPEGGDELVRHHDGSYKGVASTVRVKARNVTAIEMVSGFVSSPASDRDGAERLPRSDPDFHGTNEYAEIRKQHQEDMVVVKYDPKTGNEFKLPKEFLNRDIDIRNL